GEVFVTDGVTDAAGNPMQSFHSSYRVSVDPTTKPPSFVDYRPFCCSAQPPNTDFTMRFDEAIDPTTITDPTVVPVKNQSNGNDVPGTRTLDSTGKLFRFVPSAPFQTGATINFTFTTGIKDLQGVALATPTTRSIVIGSTPDNTTPTVTTVSPANGSTGVGVNAYLRIRFSKPLNPLTVDGTTIVLSDS